MNHAYVKHELRNRSHRTLINILGIAIGIALFVAINAVSNAYQTAVLTPFAELGADLVAQRPENSSHQRPANTNMRGVRLPFSNQPIQSSELGAIAGIDGVSAVSGSLLLWDFQQRGFRTIGGVDLAHPDIGPVNMRDWISEGRSLEHNGEAVVEKHYARFNNIKLGSGIELGGKPFKVVGLLEIKEGAQIAATNIYLGMRDAQSLLPDIGEAVNMVFIRLTDPGKMEAVKRAIANDFSEVSVSSSDSFVEMMGGMSIVSGWFSYAVSGIALFGAVLLVLKSMSANLVERTQEIGVLKALGWTRGDIQSQLFGEAIIQCLIGGVLGVLAGYAGAYLIGMMSISLEGSWDLNPLPATAKAESGVVSTIQLPIQFSWLIVGVALVSSLVIGCLAAWVMNRTTSAMKPSIILRKI